MNTVRRLWPYLRPDRWVVGLAAVAMLPVAALQLVQPVLLKRAIDEHIVPGALDGLGAVAAAYLGAAVLAYALESAHNLALAYAGQRMIVRIREDLFRFCLRLAQSFYDREPTGKLMTRLTTDLDAIGEALRAGGVSIVLDLLVIVGVLGTLFALHAQLTLGLLLLLPPLLVVLEVLRRRLRVLFVGIRDALSALNAFMAERVDGVQIVQLYNDHARAQKSFDDLGRRFRDLSSQSNIYDALMFAVVDGMGAVLAAAMLWYGSGMAAHMGLPVGVPDDVTPGLLVAFVDAIDRLFRPLRELSSKIALLQRAEASVTKIAGLFTEGVSVRPGSVVRARLDGRVQLRGVRFRYRPEGPEILRGVDLDVAPGEVVALVGATGSGKSTLVRLLDRSYDGYEGSITVDGVELRDLDTATLRRGAAAVRQDAQLFSDTVRFNVDLDNPRVDEDTRLQATRVARADALVEAMGWDHRLRERGADLSVGEAQLLSIARTLAHDPSLVLLDEATASVDSVTEARVQKATEAILERKTVLVIAHRLSTIEKADRIAVMEHGRVVEVGSHQELLAKGGAYTRMVEAARELR